VARQSASRGSAQPARTARSSAAKSTASKATAEPVDEAVETERSAATERLWSDVRIEPVEIALPKGVGYTLRAYRLSTDVTPTDVSERESDDDFTPRRHLTPVEDKVSEATDWDVAHADDDLAEDEDDVGDDDEGFTEEDLLDEEEEDDLIEEDEDPGFDDEDEDDLEDEEDDEEDEDDDEDEEEDEAAEVASEDVPVFLGAAGRLYLFRTVEGLVEFVQSGTDNDLSQLDTWSDLVDKISVADVVPLPEDTYELDLVVDNLRAGHDAWDPSLIIQAGEVARDLGFAMRIDPVVSALSPGSPLDDLDDALRATEGGGVGKFFARRKLKKIGTEAAPLGWRTIIGKISSVVDWRD
jgi:hypothetical protein